MLYVVRHGRTAANADGRLLGRLDVDLDDEGQRQAAALAHALPSGARVVSSPLARTCQTAEIIAGDRSIETDERWIELDYGRIDGSKLSDLPAEMWARWRADPDFAPAGGESLSEMGRRVTAACDDLGPSSIDEDVIVVSHVSPIKAAVSWALGVGIEVAWRTFVAPASITTIGYGDLGPMLRSFNEVAHLA
jgi:probable phosphoglycerate mutase